MESRIIKIVSWLFACIGIASLVGAGFAGGRGGELPLLIIGLAFLLLGGGVIAMAWRRRRRAQELKANGRLVQADVTGVELNTVLEVNGRNPYQVTAQWHDIAANQLHLFRSDNLWFDPSEFLRENVTVYIDPANPRRYHVDLSFLPKATG